jgi:hypothetical protein
MPAYLQWLIAAAALIVLIPAAIWLGHAYGQKAARAFPGMAAALWVFGAFFRIDPPPPPQAERVHKDEEDAGAPPAP